MYGCWHIIDVITVVNTHTYIAEHLRNRLKAFLTGRVDGRAFPLAELTGRQLG